MREVVESQSTRGGAGFEFTPNRVALGFALIAAIGIGLFLYIRYTQTQLVSIEQARSEAASELDLIRPMPGSQFVRRGTIAKGSHGTVTDYYRSLSNYEDIRDYYHREFARLKWKSEYERKVLVRDQDVGAMQLVFCKEGERGTLFFLGKDETRENITYTIGTTWGFGCGRTF